MKKTVFLLILVSLVLFPLFSESTRDTFLNSKHNNDVLPVDSVVGQTSDSLSSQNHRALEKALSEEFSFEWLETYLATSFRETAARLWSEKLSSILPAEHFVMSTAKKNADESVSISVRLLDNSTVIHFAVRDGLIEAMGF